MQQGGAFITQVLAVDQHECGLLVVLTDRRLDDAPVIWAGATLANRVSGKRARRCLLIRRSSRVDITRSTDVILTELPADLRMGDIIAIPLRVPNGAAARVS